MEVFMQIFMHVDDFIVELRLQAAGDAPILKQRNYKVDGDRKVEWILAFLRKYLRMDESEHLVIKLDALSSNLEPYVQQKTVPPSSSST